MKKYPYANLDFSFLETTDLDPIVDAIDNSFRFDYLVVIPKCSDLDIDYFDFSYLDHVWEEKD